MRACTRTLVLAGFLTVAASAAEPEIIWQIGKPDRSYREFAIAGDVSAYAKTFPRDTEFVVGKSDPAREFSFIQPGPSDHWAGLREHRTKVTFDLPSVQPGAYELRIELVDTHAAAPPALRVDVNGQFIDLPLEPGTGDISLLHPEKGKPRVLRFVFGPDRLKQGENIIRLRTTRGSWLLYDAVTLSKLAGGANPPMDVATNASIFFVEREGQLLQELSISANGIVSDAPVKVEIRSGVDRIGTAELPAPVLGAVSGHIHVQPTEQPRQIEVTVTCGEQTGVASTMQTPQRKWRIFVAPATHTDIGYTDIQSKVIELHNRNTDLALELARDYPLYHWNLESSWAAQMWLRDRPPSEHERLYAASRGRRLGIESGYLNMLTGLCSEEEIIRNLYYSARLARDHGVPFESNTLTDAPSHVWTVPSILAGAGIRCLSVGINGTRAPLLKQNVHHKSPFWWEGPDGARVLTWFAVGYSQAGQIGLREGPQRMRSAIENDLQWWMQRKDYPYDAILLHGAYSDNVAIADDIARSITEYSKRYAFPQVTLCANNNFFEYIEQNFADKIQTVRGCGGSWWEDGAGSTAVETGINRVVHQDVIAAESVWAVLAGTNPQQRVPQAAFDRIWDNVLLYDEHTWGAWNSISDPTSDFVARQWAVKAAYATDAADETTRVLDEGLRTLAARVSAPGGGGLLIFNPSGRPRSGIVHTKLHRNAAVTDGANLLPLQTVRQDLLDQVEVVLLVPEVPALGYVTYGLTERPQAQQAPKRFENNVLENEHYRVTFDPAAPGVVSIVDKHLGKELVDASSKYKLGQLVYAAGGGQKQPDGREATQVECPNLAEVKFTSPTGSKVEPGASGPVYSSARCISNMPMFPHFDMEVILYEQVPRIDLTFKLRKQMTFNKEAVYIAFPFAGANPQFRYEIGGGSVRPNEDHMSGGCRDWFAVQRWVTVNTDEAAVAWSPVDTPLITLCDMTPGKWLDTLPIANGTIFAYVMNNYWFTNYKAGQDGEFVFRYSLTSDAKIDPMKASLFGEAAASPLRAVRVPGGSEGGLPPKASFCRVEPDSVTLTALKRADDGKGLIVRVRETSGGPADVVISHNLQGVQRASACDLVERVRGPLQMDGGKVRLKLGANAMATVRLE